MKKLSIITLFTVFIFISCKKDDSAIVGKPITIEGISYNTVKIGTQTWTSVNYNGSGGVNYNDSANEPREGKLYSFQELQKLDNLPQGWRVPTTADAQKLMLFLGASYDYQAGQQSQLLLTSGDSQKIIMKDSWKYLLNNEVNTVGLNIYPTGYFIPYSNGFEGKGTAGSFWLSDKNNMGSGSYFIVYGILKYNSLTLSSRILTSATVNDGFSEKRNIRLVRDN